MKRWRLFSLSTVVTLVSACGDPELETPAPAQGYRVETQLIDTLAKPVWSVEVADFDGDGRDDLLLSGHRGTEGEWIYPGEPQGLGAPFRVLRTGADRHHCTAGDINDDGLPDLYCTTGAGRGSGISANELWLNVPSPGQTTFAPAVYEHGAEEPYSRGRLAAFFRMEPQAPMALLSTVWGERDDDQPNASRVWRQQDGVFERLPFELPSGFGGRCLKVIDLEGDGIDELFACAEERGLHQLTVVDPTRAELSWLRKPVVWWWGVDAIRVGSTGGSHSAQPEVLVALVGGGPERQFVELQGLHASGAETWRRRLDCGVHNPKSHADIYCAAVLLHDMNGDGHPDLYISRRRGWMLEEQVADMDDLIVLGPSFDRYLPVPVSSSGYGYLAVVVNGELVRLSAGESWAGALERVRLLRE